MPEVVVALLTPFVAAHAMAAAALAGTSDWETFPHAHEVARELRGDGG